MKHYDSYLKPIENYQEIDVIISKACTLNCAYCYVNKTSKSDWNQQAILSSLDNVLNETLSKNETTGVVIGLFPEPWVDINRSNDFIKSALKLMENKYQKYFSNHMFMLGTNGVNLHKPIPILNHIKNNLSLAVTIDGIKEQHDLYRVFADGSGSWDIVTKNVKEYQYEYNIFSTKVTLGPETIKYIFDSSLYLWNELNIIDINMNVVFENIWGSEKEKEKSIEEFDIQLDKLSSYIINNKLWNKNKYNSIVGSHNIPTNTIFSATPYCGAAKMRTIDIDGEVYPCMRFAPFNLEGEDKKFKINSNTERMLKLYNVYDSAPIKCLKCNLLSVCPMCAGGAYDESKQLYYRSTHHCEFIKLQNKYAQRIEDAILKEENK